MSSTRGKCLPRAVFSKILRICGQHQVGTESVCYALHTRKADDQYLCARRELLNRGAELEVFALDSVIPVSASKQQGNVNTMKPNPLGAPRCTPVARVLKVKIQEYVANIPGRETCTHLHEHCELCAYFAKRGNRAGKLRSQDYKLLQRLHSLKVKACLKLLAMKRAASTTNGKDGSSKCRVEGVSTAAGSESGHGKAADLGVMETSHLKSERKTKPNRRQRKQARQARLSAIENELDRVDIDITRIKRSASDPFGPGGADRKRLLDDDLPALKAKRKTLVSVLKKQSTTGSKPRTS